MNFQISGLHERHFQHLFGQTSEVLAKHGVERITVDSRPGYPCRVSLKDVNIGETVLLMNYKHLPALSPYRSSHAIFVMEGAKGAIFGKNHIPEMLRNRLLSVRAFDANEMMVDADVVDGLDLEPIIERMFSIELVDFLHIHNAKRGCFMARAVSGRSISPIYLGPSDRRRRKQSLRARQKKRAPQTGPFSVQAEAFRRVRYSLPADPSGPA
ncbi:MAG: DUF1203 domain-containing protein [Gammaproteobacteria bacterium]|nr:DUF1203 domain-containing protein [Gammaproteobacteria bacterium]